MRFDDRLATILALPDDSASARAAKWRQLVDVLGQGWLVPDPGQLGQALDYLRAHRDSIDPAVRLGIARSVGGRRTSPILVRLFAEDEPAIVESLLSAVNLSAEEWRALLPDLGQAARDALRRRTDLPAEALTGLGRLTPQPTPKTGPAAAPPAPPAADGEQGETQIRELVTRIEDFRRRHPPEPPRPLSDEDAARVQSFRWETGPDGVILWVEGVPRGPLIGQGIGAAVGKGEHGVDGQAAGAFARKAPFRDARLSVAGIGPAAGDWRMSGVPFFHPRHGSFLGYRGTARRPRIDEVARQAPDAGPVGLFGTSLPAESLRNLIHELRTPLNAIVGFAEMIDGQYLGPAGGSYRARARDIIEQADKLIAAVDDLDTAARIETRRLDLSDSSSDAVALLSGLVQAYGGVVLERRARIDIEFAPDLPRIRVDETAAERMFGRLLASTVGLLRPDEAVNASVTLAAREGRDMLCLAIERPPAIRGLDESVLLDPGYSPEGDWPGAPLLGLGFALRLVRNLAQAVGGALVIGDMVSLLYLPIDQNDQSSLHGR